MADYVRIPIRDTEHKRLVQMQNQLQGQIDSYLSRPSLSDVIKYLLDQQEIQTMNSPYGIIARTAIYNYTSDFSKDSTPLHEQNIALMVSAERGSWYIADVGTEAEDRERLEAKAQTLIGKPIDPDTMFYSGEATYHLGLNEWHGMKTE